MRWRHDHRIEPATITLYGRPGCHLCDLARTELQELSSQVTFVLSEIDIDSDETLLKRYLERIPVIALDGVEIFDFELDQAALLERLRRRRRIDHLQ